jgi:hypothetical protein
MPNISYEHISSQLIEVYLEGRWVGEIRALADGGYAYFSRFGAGSPHGDIFPTIGQVKASLEEE